jgi:hypothetical protein
LIVFLELTAVAALIENNHFSLSLGQFLISGFAAIFRQVLEAVTHGFCLDFFGG